MFDVFYLMGRPSSQWDVPSVTSAPSECLIPGKWDVLSAKWDVLWGRWDVPSLIHFTVWTTAHPSLGCLVGHPL
jgi:hypothetical protein